MNEDRVVGDGVHQCDDNCEMHKHAPMLQIPDGARPLTLRRDPADNRDFVFKMERPMMLPSVIDHTDGMSPVKDQGRLGSCVGFAVTALKEWQEKKEHLEEIAEGKRGDGDKVYDLSEQWLYYKCKEIDPWPGEEGSSIRYGMKVLHRVGVPTEKAWPYNDVNVGEPESWANLVARWSLIESYTRVSNMYELKKALVNNPVPIGIPCFYEFFFVGSNGVVPYPANPSQIYGGHAICTVGYDDNRKLVKFKNSWGTSWGDRGYGYLPYQYVKDFLWDAWTCADLRVTTEMLRGKRDVHTDPE